LFYNSSFVWCCDGRIVGILEKEIPRFDPSKTFSKNSLISESLKDPMYGTAIFFFMFNTLIAGKIETPSKDSINSV